MRRNSLSILTVCVAALSAIPVSADEATFQQGTGGYSGTLDTYLRKGSLSGYNYGGQDVIYVLSSGNVNPSGQGILQFKDLFGGNPGQVPATGQAIASATLTLNVEGVTIATGVDKTVKVYPMLQPVQNFGNNNNTAADLDFTPPGSYEVSYDARGWGTSTSWLHWGGGSANLGGGPVADYDFDLSREVVKQFPAAPATNNTVSIDVTNIVNAWYTGTISNNGFFLRPDDGGFTGVYITSSEGPDSSLRPKLSISFAASDPNTATWKTDGAGDWNVAANWFGTTPNVAGITAKFGSAITSPHTVYADSPVIAGGLIFDNTNRYVLAGAGSLTLQATSGSASVSVLQGSHTINLPFIIASNTTVTVAGGAALVVGNPMTVQANNTVTSSGSVSIQAPLTLESGASIVAAAGTLGVFGAPSMAAGARIDLKNNSMIVDYRGQTSPAAAIELQLTSGSANGAWNGDGIMTSSANIETGLGWVQDSANQRIVIDYTYRGDANLNGLVESTDFNALVAAFGTTSGSNWANGDFNYDDKINTLDFNHLAGNFGKPALASATLGAVVPEPGSIAAIFAIAGGVLSRRARRDAV